jgi:hypothetical protein
MHYELIEAKYVKDFQIWVRFSDGTQGIIDLENELYGEIFEPLQDKANFKKFNIHPELGVISWENGADFASEFIYENLKIAA